MSSKIIVTLLEFLDIVPFIFEVKPCFWNIFGGLTINISLIHPTKEGKVIPKSSNSSLCAKWSVLNSLQSFNHCIIINIKHERYCNFGSTEFSEQNLCFSDFSAISLHVVPMQYLVYLTKTNQNLRHRHSHDSLAWSNVCERYNCIILGGEALLNFVSDYQIRLKLILALPLHHYIHYIRYNFSEED